MQLVRGELVDGRVVRAANELKLIVVEPAALRFARQRHCYPPGWNVSGVNLLVGPLGGRTRWSLTSIWLTPPFARPVRFSQACHAGISLANAVFNPIVQFVH